MSTWGGASRPSKKKPSIISSGEPVPFFKHDGVFFLQAKESTDQATETFLPAATFGPRPKKLEGHFNILLLESSHPGIEPLDLSGGGPGIRGIGIIRQWRGEKVFLLRSFSKEKNKTLFWIRHLRWKNFLWSSSVYIATKLHGKHETSLGKGRWN